MFMQCRFFKHTLIILAAMALLSCGGAEERKAKYMERGKTYLAEKNYDKAMVEIKNVLQIDPKHAEAYFLAGQVEEQKQDMNKAFADYSKAVELNPDLEQAREKLARFYLMGLQPDKAKETVAYILKTKPNDPEAKTIEAVVLTQKNDLDGALKLASEVAKADSKQVEAIAIMSAIHNAKGNKEQATKVLLEGIASNPKNITLRSALAQQYAGEKDYAKAAEILREIIAIEPDVLSHRIGLTALYSQSKQPGEAEKVLREAIKADPKDSQRYLLLADFLMGHDARAQAESELQKAIEAYPEEMDLRFALAKYYKIVEKTDLAKNVYQKIIDTNSVGPDGMRARTELAEVLLSEKEFEKTSLLVDKVLKENAQDTQALLVRGKLALGKPKPDIQSAIADFRTILKSQPDSVDVLTLLAQAHQLNHEPDLARESLQKAVKAAPKDVNARARLAGFLMSNDKDIDGAEKVLDEFLSTSPDDLLALQGKLEILAKKKDDKGIVQLLAQIKKIAPEKPLGYYRAGEYYLSKGKQQEALHEFELARDKSKGDFQAVGAIVDIYVKTGKPEAALKELDEYLKISPKSLEAFQLKASVLASMNNTDGFFKLVDELRKLYPDKAYGYTLAGEFYLRQKNYDAALREFQSAAEKNPGDGRIMKSVVMAFLGKQKPDDALAWLAQLAKSRVDDGNVPYLTGEVLFSQKKYEQSEQQFQKASQLLPKVEDIHLMLAESNVRQNHPDGAISVLKHGLEVIPDSKKLLFRLAAAYETSGRFDDAILTYEQLLKMDQGNAIAVNNLASILSDRKGDRESLDRALKLAAPFESSSQPALLDTLGWIYYKLDKIDSALPLIKKAVDGAPKSGVLRYHLGMAYYKKGDKAAAKTELTRAFAAGEKFTGEEEGRATLKSLQ